jgi:hypothetical protein
MDGTITYDVRVYKTQIYKGARVTTYYVRWRVGGKPWKQPFRRPAQADSFRSELLAAARKGQAFSAVTAPDLFPARVGQYRPELVRVRAFLCRRQVALRFSQPPAQHR